MPNLSDLLSRAAFERPDRVAIKLDRIELSYSALDKAATQAAGLLSAHGVQPGDRVGIMLPNIPYFPICLLRRAARRRRSRADERAAQGAGGRLPSEAIPRRKYTLSPGTMFADAAQAGAELADTEVHPTGSLANSTPRWRAASRRPPRGRRAPPRRHGGAPLHVRHDRVRRRAPSSRTRTSRRNVEVTVDLFGLDERSVTLGCTAAVPRFWPDLRAQRDRRRRRAPSRCSRASTRQGAGNPRARPRNACSRASRRCTPRCSITRGPARPTHHT